MSLEDYANGGRLIGREIINHSQKNIYIRYHMFGFSWCGNCNKKMGDGSSYNEEDTGNWITVRIGLEYYCLDCARKISKRVREFIKENRDELLVYKL